MDAEKLSSDPDAPLYDPFTTFVLAKAKGKDAAVAQSLIQQGINLWRNVQALIVDTVERRTFLAALSPSQSKTFMILDDWWHSRYHNESIKGDDQALVAMLSKEAAVRDKLGPTHANTATYRGCMCNLFHSEFVWWFQLFPSGGKAQDGNVSVQRQARVLQIFKQIGDLVTNERQRALKHATWQRLSYSVWCQYRVPGFECEDTSILGSSMQPCPWLRSSQEGDCRRPLYLWDREKEMSVKVEELTESTVEYWCISHTWGRWWMEDIDMSPHVPWPVPTTSRFRVDQLPGALRTVDWPVKYVWFDLFCIPQNDCPERAVEIGKQADIFQNASACVVWLNDVDTWKIPETAVSWLGLSYLAKTTVGLPGLSELLKDLTDEAVQISSRENFAPSEGDPWAVRESHHEERVGPSGEPFRAQVDPGSAWFSSLWTLQEAYLCPGAYLADKGWNFLRTIGGVPLTLDNLTSLTYSTASDVEDGATRPGIVDQLLFIVKRWELSNLTSPSRMSLLIAADSRVSRGPRAEAIMSAVGASDWFNDHVAKTGMAHPQKNLVFGLYDLEFMEEVLAKIGPPFFLTFRFPPNTLEDAVEGRPLGTMLPLSFSPEKWQTTMSIDFHTTNWTSGTTDGWRMQLDGSIWVSQAAILAHVDSDGWQLPAVDGPIRVPTLQGQNRFDGFRALFESRPASPRTFAVAVVRYGSHQLGVILDGVESPSETGKLVLVKTAIFQTEGDWCRPESAVLQTVNWQIL